jgi:hypothetical protein
MSITQNFTALSALRKKFWAICKRYPVIAVPFVVIAAVDVVTLTALFLAPRPPVSIALAPIIRAFWGEKFLHYPVNFLLLPQLFNYGRNILSFIVGITFTGIATALIMQAYQNAEPKWWFCIQKALKKYLRLVVVWGITFGMTVLVVRALNSFSNLFSSYRILMGLEFGASIIVQMVFVFAVPAVIIENKKISASLVRSLALVKNYPITAFIFVLIPSLLFIPITYLHLKLPSLMERLVPEVVLYALVIRIITINIIDFFITSSASIVLLYHREYETGIENECIKK